MDRMIDHIKELLKTHDCVVVPGLGGLIGHYEPARRNLTSGTMAPPMKRIAFNTVLRQNDGVLIHYISRVKGISYDKSRKEVEAFVKKVEQALDEHGAYLFAGIGKLTFDDAQRLQFHPILKENLLLETFSLPLVVAQPIPRIEEQYAAETAAAESSTAMEEGRVIPATGKYPSWIFRAAAVVGMAFLMTTAGQSIFGGGFSGDQLSFLPAKSQPVALKAVQPVPQWTGSSDFKLFERAAVEVQPASDAGEVLPSSATFDGIIDRYYVIVGSFLDEVRLQREINAMTGAGYTVRTLPGPNGYTRVGLEFDARTFPRKSKLEEIRASVNKDAWLING